LANSPSARLFSAARVPQKVRAVLLRTKDATVADADPGALARILERFQTLNVFARRVIAELATTGVFDIEVDVTGVPEKVARLITGKLGQLPSVLNACWRPL
jgi:hypothetical protein